MLASYRAATLSADVDFAIGLSSMGAQHESGTGNLTVSYKLERLFVDTNIRATFIRPAYYYSNWLGYLDAAKDSGFLPSFFPPDLSIPMVAPYDVATFAADVMTGVVEYKPLYEIHHSYYSAEDIAREMGSAIGKEVTVAAIPQGEWISSLKQVGFSDSGASNLSLMTGAVVDGRTAPETNLIKCPTGFQSYITEAIRR
jgi:uncharacterized protein YbjT (DUF2867 family)